MLDTGLGRGCVLDTCAPTLPLFSFIQINDLISSLVHVHTKSPDQPE